MLGIQYPVIQGGMAWVADASLAAAVSNAGGHVGELHTMPLVPQVVDAAAFMLGADAVQMGTRFLSAEECTVHQEYKDKILKASDVSTIVTGKSFGHPVRSLKTPFSRNFAKMEADPSVNQEDILAFGSGALRKAVQEGDRNGSYMVGECAGMVKKTEPAKDIVEDVIFGAEKVMAEALSRVF